LTAILLVHGAWHGPWCWEGVAERLASHGHQVEAVQLRGHDHPPGRIWHRVHHYLQDVEEAAARFIEPPVLVGHSLGGLVVQRYLERGRARGAVLLAPLPSHGTLPAIARLSLRHPLVMLKANLSLRLRPLVATPGLVRELFFTATTPQQLVDDTSRRLQDESWPALVDSVLVWPRPRRVQVPVLVMGAEHDGFFTLAELGRTAAAYRTEAEILPGMGHDLMLDQGWPQVADRIDTWIRETLSPDATAAGQARAAILRFLGYSLGEDARSPAMPWVEPGESRSRGVASATLAWSGGRPKGAGWSSRPGGSAG
jgi:pimeloyl-ACP methyl ester carboxylesterase